MKVLVLGGDGYLGWPACMHFANEGHEVACVDNFVKRVWEARNNVSPLKPIATLRKRVVDYETISGKKIKTYIGDLAESSRFVYEVFGEFLPDVVIHLAEQPSAPFSMQSRSDCVETQANNIIGNLNVMFAIQKFCPNCHIVKLGTMGEYGTPNIRIEEGWLNVEHNGRSDRVLFPKKPGSFYHCSKVADSVNLEFACRIWGMSVTDLNQGVVYGMPTIKYADIEGLHTSFHYDEMFGTVLNRFITQAVAGFPLSVYGNGSQTRGFLHINDTLKCLQLAAENPAVKGEFRVFNQFTETFSILDLANKVAEAGAKFGSDVTINHLDNPRVEQYDHFYEATNSGLMNLGLDPTLLSGEVITEMYGWVSDNRENIDTDSFRPATRWNQN